MEIISQDVIKDLNINPSTCISWVKESFSVKKEALLPPKVCIHPQGIDFFTSMPCLLPNPYNTFCLKLVHRISGAVPALGSDALLYSVENGDLLALVDMDWITAMRTGAVAIFAAQTFRKKNATTYGFVGLGNTARATLLCLLDDEKDKKHKVLLLKYKNQAESFIERFDDYKNVSFIILDTIEEIVRQSDVLFSCITETTELLCPNNDCFQKGCTIIPVHTRGFQNCDLFFDKVYSDDTGHVAGFKYFNQFQEYAEIQDVIEGKHPGRTSDEERILSYNVGIGLHDAVFATKIYRLLENKNLPEISIVKESSKFWI